MSKIGVIDVGGGFRGIYAAAVLDRCMDDGVTFDVGYGISAGSANIASFLAGQKGRNWRFYVEYGSRKEYASLRNLLLKRTFIDMDYVYGTLSNEDGEDPIDFDTMMENPAEFIVIATDAKTGKAKYFRKRDMKRDRYQEFKASCAIPGVCKPYEVDGVPCFDGALGDPVPVQTALDDGCDRIVLLLTKPKDVLRKPGNDIPLSRLIQRKYPRSAEALRARADKYNKGVNLAKELEAEGRALIVAPDDTCGVSTFTRDADALAKLYAKGYGDGEVVQRFVLG